MANPLDGKEAAAKSAHDGISMNFFNWTLSCVLYLLRKYFFHESSHAKKHTANAISGAVQMYLPASVFSDCATKKWPLNTLFPDVDRSSVGFDQLQTYLPLVLALYDLSPMGTMVNQRFGNVLGCGCCTSVVDLRVCLIYFKTIGILATLSPKLLLLRNKRLIREHQRVINNHCPLSWPFEVIISRGYLPGWQIGISQ